MSGEPADQLAIDQEVIVAPSLHKIEAAALAKGRAFHGDKPQLDGPGLRLWASVLRLAWQDLSDPAHSAAALGWFRNTTREDPGSLQWICGIFDLRPDYLSRLAIRRAKRTALELRTGSSKYRR